MKYGLVEGSLLFFKIVRGQLKDLAIPGLAHPITLREGTSDLPTFVQVFLNSEYDIPMDAPQVIIDGGANIGLFALEMKNRFPGAKIICVEPDPENFALLKKNVSPFPDIHCENCGIWSSDTRLNVTDRSNMGTWAMMVEEDSEHGEIPAICLSSLLDKHDLKHVDLMKLDIETSEKQVFSSTGLNWLRKVKMLVMELHDEMEEGCSKPFFEAINKVYSSYRYSIRGENTIIENLGFGVKASR